MRAVDRTAPLLAGERGAKSGWEPGMIQTADPRVCCWCGRYTASQEHHIIPKGMGGRHGAAKAVSEANGNKVRLCLVCHGAAHHERVTDSDGFSCRVCPRGVMCEHNVMLREWQQLLSARG